MTCKSVNYPPISVFPRNPQLANHIDPLRLAEKYMEDADTFEARSGKKTSNRKDSLEFVPGPAGIRNIIKVSSSPYIDYSKYDWDNNVWVDDFRPIDIQIINGTTTPKDHTKYTSTATPSFSNVVAASILDLEYYYNGEVIVTNYDFTDPADRGLIEITYSRLTRTVKVKAVMVTNSTGVVFSTPTVDQYTMLVGKQRMVK